MAGTSGDQQRDDTGATRVDQRPELTSEEIDDLVATELPSREAMSIIMPPGLGGGVAIHGPHERLPIEPEPQE